MAIRLKVPLALLALQLAAFWPVWRWQAARITDSSDDAWGWVALLTAAAFSVNAWKVGQTLVCRDGVDRLKSVPPIPTKLWLPALLTLVYALSFPFVTPLPRAILAMAALGTTLSVWCFRSTFHSGICGLLMLSLPLMASLQFYLGFPLRAAVAAVAAPLLQLGGLAVIREGTCLNWNGQSISVDAPCSGIKMLWTGMYLTFTLACLFRLNARRTAAAALLAFVVILIGNTLRAVTLFYLESGIVNLPDSLSGAAHSAAGVMMFLLTALTIGRLVARLKKETPLRFTVCEPQSSSLPAAQ